VFDDTNYNVSDILLILTIIDDIEPLNQLLYARIAYPTNDLCNCKTLVAK